jgi:Lon protease-like protein
MVLSDCWLLPGCYLPLYIFEQRYRDMLEVALSTHRMFGIATRVMDDSDEVLPSMTVGIIHECYKHEDGTAHLVLLGARRVRIQSWSKRTVYPLAKVEPILRDSVEIGELETLRDEALSLLPSANPIDTAKQVALIKALRAISDPELACDFLTYHFIRCPDLTAKSMRMTCAVGRFKLLIEALAARA